VAEEFLMIEAAQALGCKPWELDSVPTYWQEYGRVYAQVKQGADLQLQAQINPFGGKRR